VWDMKGEVINRGKKCGKSCGRDREEIEKER
jgi:hypothetical protein